MMTKKLYGEDVRFVFLAVARRGGKLDAGTQFNVGVMDGGELLVVRTGTAPAKRA